MPINDYGNVGAKTANIGAYVVTFVECQLCTVNYFKGEKSSMQSEGATFNAR